MNLSRYYSLYNRFKTGKIICLGAHLAKIMHMRYLLVRLDTNFLCNLRCKTCYFSGPDAAKHFLKPMPLDLFKVIASDVFSKTRILYLSCGGEPLMTKRFEDFIEVTGRYSVPYVGYVTNGLLFNENIIRSSIENKVSEITISIDGATKDTYEYIRVGGKFDKLIEKLNLYKDIASTAKKQLPSLRFNFTVTKTNHLEMPLLVNLAKRFGVSSIKFRIYNDWGGVLSPKDESLVRYEESFNRSLREAKKLAAEAGIYVFSPVEFSKDTTSLPLKDHKKMLDKFSRPPCVYPWFYRYIDPIGRVRVCACLPLSKTTLSEKYSLRDFDKSEEETLRKILLRKDPLNSCFASVCKGAYLRRANDDVNFLK